MATGDWFPKANYPVVAILQKTCRVVSSRRKLNLSCVKGHSKVLGNETKTEKRFSLQAVGLEHLASQQWTSSGYSILSWRAQKQKHTLNCSLSLPAPRKRRSTQLPEWPESLGSARTVWP